MTSSNASPTCTTAEIASAWSTRPEEIIDKRPYRKVLDVIRANPDDYGFEAVFHKLVDRLDPPPLPAWSHHPRARSLMGAITRPSRTSIKTCEIPHRFPRAGLSSMGGVKVSA